MAVKISSPRTELAVLRAACTRDEIISGTILSSLDESYFYTDEAIEVFDTLRRMWADRGTPPNYRLLLENPELSRHSVDFLRNSERSITSKNEVLSAISTLGEFRRRRMLVEMRDRIDQELSSGKPDTRKALDQVTQDLFRARQNKDAAKMTIFGKGDNAEALVENMLYGDRTKHIVPTGFKTYDRVNAGFLLGSLVTIGGTTGGGKSTLANQLAVNMAMRGFDVDVVPLEMSEEEMTARIMATVTRFDSMKIVLQKLTENEKDYLMKRFRKWRKHVEGKGGSYGIYKPLEDVTIEETYMSLNSRNSHVRIIDYMGLLAGMDGDDSWRKLGNAARTGKINASSTGSVNILLAQVDETGKLRYSRAVQEHATNSWIFVHTKETREAGILNIEQPKARNQKSFPFTLKVDADFMRVYDMPDNGVDSDSNEPAPVKTNLRNLADE